MFSLYVWGKPLDNANVLVYGRTVSLPGSANLPEIRFLRAAPVWDRAKRLSALKWVPHSVWTLASPALQMTAPSVPRLWNLALFYTASRPPCLHIPQFVHSIARDSLSKTLKTVLHRHTLLPRPEFKRIPREFRRVQSSILLTVLSLTPSNGSPCTVPGIR